MIALLIEKRNILLIKVKKDALHSVIAVNGSRVVVTHYIFTIIFNYPTLFNFVIDKKDLGLFYTEISFN